MRFTTARCVMLISFVAVTVGCSMPTVPKMKWPSFAKKSTPASSSTLSNAPSAPALASSAQPQGTTNYNNNAYSPAYSSGTQYPGSPYAAAQPAGTQYPVTPYPTTPGAASNAAYYPQGTAQTAPAGGYMPPQTGAANPYAAQPANPYAAAAAPQDPSYTANQYNGAPAGSAPAGGTAPGTYTR